MVFPSGARASSPGAGHQQHKGYRPGRQVRADVRSMGLGTKPAFL